MESNIFSTYRDWLEHERMPKGKKAALVAAVELFSETGFDGTSTVQIAEKAGISQATIFKYFHTKQDLLLAIVRPVMENFFPKYRDDFFAEMSQFDTLPELIRFIVSDRYQFVAGNVEVIKILFMEMMSNPGIRQLFGKIVSSNNFDFLSEMLDKLKQTGQLRTDVDAAGLVRIIGGQIGVYLVQSHLVPSLVHGDERDLQLISDQVIRTISK
ncbi:TetR/AcrR family transcriptional regulator [Levilactobacillus yonginensis]|uniref:TetR/AcrR family transcriptional regulator n=1 Tax=Levilactobacillus yonginensis TaxID=1054041 RepID=UPI00345CFF81